MLARGHNALSLELLRVGMTFVLEFLPLLVAQAGRTLVEIVIRQLDVLIVPSSAGQLHCRLEQLLLAFDQLLTAGFERCVELLTPRFQMLHVLSETSGVAPFLFQVVNCLGELRRDVSASCRSTTSRKYPRVVTLAVSNSNRALAAANVATTGFRRHQRQGARSGTQAALRWFRRAKSGQRRLPMPGR